MNKPPAFQFYANDWLGSTQIMLMTPAEEGAYIRLLAIAWNDKNCSLPDDDDVLAKLSRLGEEWHSHSGAIIRKCFKEKNGRLFNERLLKEKRKIEAFKKERSKSGKIGAEKRWNKDDNSKRDKNSSANSSAITQPMAKNSSSSSFSSSSSNKNNNIYIILSQLLGELILKRSPNDFHVKKAQKNGWVKWAESIRKMVEEEGCSLEEIEKVIKWCQEDDFWKTNIRSTSKLRLQFGQLIDKMKNGKKEPEYEHPQANQEWLK